MKTLLLRYSIRIPHPRALVAMLALATQALGAGSIIGVNIDEVTGRRPITPADLAGATADTRVGNWNNIPCDKNSPPPGSSYVFSDGKPVPAGFAVAWTLRPTWISALNPSAVNDAALFSGYSEVLTSGSVTLRGIPFASYDLYVYVRGGHPARGGAISIGGGQATFYVRGGAKTLDTGAEYVAAKSTSYDPQSPALVEPANYVVFRGLSGPGQTLQIDALDMGNQFLRLMVCGFQIVER